MTELKKPTHAKPSYYSIMFEPLKEIALKYGYNLVLHGSLNRDMDLIAIPWSEDLGDIDIMIDEFCDYIGGKIQLFNRKREDDGRITGDRFTPKPHGRIVYVINVFRGGYFEGDGFTTTTFFKDPQTYLDISVVPKI